MTSFNLEAARPLNEQLWDDENIPAIEDYIEIPNVSVQFDPNWKANGHMDRAVELLTNWARRQPIKGMTIAVNEIDGRTPLILIEIESTSDSERTVLMYGHLDKQPPFEGWDEGLGPWDPVIRDGKLYGRGGADDGYALFASLTAIRLLQEQGVSHSRIVIVIEASEESGSPDLPAHIDELSDRIGSPDLVICLDSGCGNYEQLWTTTSLRGVIAGNLRVDVLTEGVHSGASSGIVTDSLLVAVDLIGNRIVDLFGKPQLTELTCVIPQDRVDEAALAAQVLGASVYAEFPWARDPKPIGSDSISELILDKTWRPAVTVIGAEGLPTLKEASNTMRTHTALRLSIRTPPTVNATAAAAAVKRALEGGDWYGATVSFDVSGASNGWNAPSLVPWLSESIQRASQACFGKPAVAKGEGGSIPFMGMLGEKFPDAQFLITGVLGPHSNAHGPNEFLHIGMVKRVTEAVAMVLADHAKL